jgi:hypothetical protein
MNSLRSLVRQAAVSRQFVAKRTITSTPASLSDHLFIVSEHHFQVFNLTLFDSIVIHLITMPVLHLNSMRITKSVLQKLSKNTLNNIRRVPLCHF